LSEDDDVTLTRLIQYLFAVLLAGSLAWAEDRVIIADFSSGVDAKGVPPGWQVKEKSGKADFAVVKDGDFRKSRTDDQAAQLFLAFTKTKAIVYIWDTTAPQGLMESTSPVPFMTVKVVVVRSGPAELGKWINETRNVYEDYKKFYGEDPPVVSGIRLQINSQHTGTSGESWFADVVFKKL
jgi:hypothetical protein